MKILPIRFFKPKRGKDSCESVYMELNSVGVASCLRATHITDFTSDDTNGVLVVDETDTDNNEI